MARQHVLVTRRLPGPALERLAQTLGETGAALDLWLEDGAMPDAVLRERVGPATGLLCVLSDRIDADLLACADRLAVISSCSVGLDHVDLEVATRRGIPVGHTPGILVETTVELAFGLLLAVARRIPEADRFVRDGRWTPESGWDPALLLGRDLAGARLGIVGLGAIGQAMATRAQAFGMETLGWTPSGRRVDGVRSLPLTELLAASDFVSLHLAYGRESHMLLDAERLARMKPGAVLIDTARGRIVDEAALARALHEGRLGGAGLDVFEREPIPANNPLLGAPNLVLTPHIGSASLRTRSRMASLSVDNLLVGLEGRPLPHCGNPSVYERSG